MNWNLIEQFKNSLAMKHVAGGKAELKVIA